MTEPVSSRAQILTVAGLLGALALAVPAASDAQTVQGYTCADRTQSGATSASISLTDPPASIDAGQSLSLQAGLTMTLPQSFDLAAKASLISQVGVSTTTFGLQVQIGKTVEVVPASIVVGQLQPLGLPDETVSAALTFPAVRIPRTATGDVVISMPTAAQYPNSATSTPAEVVFNTVLEQENYLGTPSSSNLACSDSSTPAPAAQVVAQIPIQGAAATTKAATSTTKSKTTSTATQSATTTRPTKPSQSSKHPSASTPTRTPATGAAAPSSQSATGLDAAGTPAVSDLPGASAAGAASPTSASAPTSASSSDGTTPPAAAETPTSVTIPPRTVGRGTFIPTWELILMGSVLPIAALGYAWHTRRTYRAARTDLQQRRRSTPPDPDGSAPAEVEPASPLEPSMFVPHESQTRT